MKEPEYNLHTRHTIPRDYKCCWNCFYMQWMVALGQGARCSSKKNEYRVFREKDYTIDFPDSDLKMPVIPGVAKSCEHYVNKYERATRRRKYTELYANDRQISISEAEEEIGFE
ncbi:uncharacterized protein METZ01_LOCUS504619 [marine metagenome]|uniref:Uncharacterized protein n=1 Tax=marine metagenome TaxID=408172 RepID=A0A383E5V8_9ZZZZ